ncbi:uncharacterized protein LTR77_001729 [Saxophila tyrrhenica]|uniref:DUF7918 domain-containing protein n=1 Tax=Saxophila tyrrhenica TaxID=1690608 RepID=A0AAV9PMY0_9PEZI|nr:hypothetical protein LTR77_001729 [Saxophila tyrrhenica]
MAFVSQLFQRLRLSRASVSRYSTLRAPKESGEMIPPIEARDASSGAVNAAASVSDYSIFKEDEKYSRKACLTALQGEKVPEALGHPLHEFCTVHGIRYHSGFGDELHGSSPIFARALNARRIMSGIIPDIKSPLEMPYCIWHPVTALEKTYRELVQRYPQMAYHVARACAVAGYTRLYGELDVLPDVHVAEEARECGNMAIYDAVVSQPVRYSIMNDYTRSVDVDSRQAANLNGDTCVCWMLNIKQKLPSEDDVADPLFGSLEYQETMFDLCEDHHFDERNSEAPSKSVSASRPELRLLHEPLPADLPTVQKDLLILMAAYHGNVDRYISPGNQPELSSTETRASRASWLFVNIYGSYQQLRTMKLATSPGVTVDVCVDGVALQEYDDPGEAGNDEPLKRVKYIEAVPGSNFTIRLQTIRAQLGGCEKDVLDWTIHLDGKYATDRIASVYSTSAYCSSIEVVDRKVGSAYVKECFTFAELNTDEGPLQGLKPIDFQQLGEIEVRCVFARRTGASRPLDGESFTPVSKGKALPEKVLKGRAISSQVSLGQPELLNYVPTVSSLNWPYGKKPFATYAFRYRSHRDLQIENIIPRSPSPVPLEDRDPEFLTLEEARELLRRNREKDAEQARTKEEKVRVKKEKRDRESFENDDDLAITGENQANKRTRLSTDSGIEIVDLTDL